MSLTDDQKQAVQSWISAGMDLGEIQKRLREEFQISITYLEARLLMDDLKLSPIDAEEPETTADSNNVDGELQTPEDAGPAPGSVHVSVDQIVRSGSLISGKVVFSDGERAEWHFDQTGRLGLVPEKTGYRPSQDDIMAFQVELQRVASSQGL